MDTFMSAETGDISSNDQKLHAMDTEFVRHKVEIFLASNHRQKKRKRWKKPSE